MCCRSWENSLMERGTFKVIYSGVGVGGFLAIALVVVHPAGRSRRGWRGGGGTTSPSTSSVSVHTHIHIHREREVGGQRAQRSNASRMEPYLPLQSTISMVTITDRAVGAVPARD